MQYSDDLPSAMHNVTFTPNQVTEEYRVFGLNCHGAGNGDERFWCPCFNKDNQRKPTTFAGAYACCEFKQGDSVWCDCTQPDVCTRLAKP
jgi:hypothetical protein